MATMIGLIVVLIPAMGLFGLAFGTAVVLLRRRSALRSAWGMSSSMLVIMALSFYYQIDRQLLMGLIALGMLVLARSVIGHQRRRRGFVDGGNLASRAGRDLVDVSLALGNAVLLDHGADHAPHAGTDNK